MRPFLEWLDTEKFYVRQAWDIEQQKWVGNGPLLLFPFQRRILGHCLTPNPETGLLPYSTILYSCPKKSGKTTIAAAVGTWTLEEAYAANEGTEVYVSANILEQAKERIMRDILFHINHYRQDMAIATTTSRATYPDGTFAQALQQSYKAVAGGRHKLTLWDELWGITQEVALRNWDELTPVPTVPSSFRFVATYAGFEVESKLLRNLYERGVGPEEFKEGGGTRVPGLEDLPCWENEGLFVYWDHARRMPWQTPEYYKSQRLELRPAAFIRLHDNRWVSSQEEFLPIQWWDEATEAFPKSAERWPKHPYVGYPVFMGVDGSTKKDTTSVVGVCYDWQKGEVIDLFHRIWTPRQDEMFDLTTIENYLIKMYNMFNVVKVVYDPTQLHQMMTNLQKADILVEEFSQSPANMTKASQNLYDLLKEKSLRSYPDKEAREHIRMTVAESKGRGFRIVKGKSSEDHPIDYTVALAMAAYSAIESGGVDISEDVVVESPFSDFSAVKESDISQKDFPHELRTEDD